MRIADIVLNEEYAETGPLAYGAEPHVTPVRVRFLDKTPFTWVREWEVKEPVESERRPGAFSYPLDRLDSIPMTMGNARAVAATTESDRYAYSRQQPVGTRFKTYDATLKGYYLCERQRNGVWYKGLCQSSAVHRTWAEVEEREVRRRQADHEAKVAAAPTALVEHVRKALQAAGHIAEQYEGSIPAHLVYDEVYKQTETWPHFKPSTD